MSCTWLIFRTADRCSRWRRTAACAPQRHTLLQPGGSCRVLDKRERVRLVAGLGQFPLAAERAGVGRPEQSRITQRDMTQQIIGKLVVDDHGFRVKICGHTGQSEAIL